MEPIKVGVRVRPATELDRRGGEAVALKGEELTLLTQTPKIYSFDYCFTASDGSAIASNVTQEAVFAEIGQKLVTNTLNGYNGCLFAYGQTGSGKSYTVMGLGDQPGLIPRSLAYLFTRKAQASQPLLRVWVSYAEIYNEQVRDLLSLVDEGPCDLKVLDHPRLGVCIPQLTEAVCETSDDVKNLLEFGMIRRVIAATHMNERSSRSHTIFTLRVHGQEAPYFSGRLNLTDLAGSERQALSRTEGLLLKEGCAINQGLSALALVVKELGNQQAHSGLLHARATRYQVGFRTSKLTLLMKDALAGNAKTYMLATISPCTDSLEETASTLTFAESLARVKTAPVQAKGGKEEFLEQLQEEVRKLEDQHVEGALTMSSFSALATDLEALVQSSTMEYEAQVALSQEMSQARKAYLQRQGILESFGEQRGVSMDMPYLLNMSDDPMVVGCLRFHLPGNQVTTIGSGEGQSIPLRGIGFVEQLCKIINVSNAALSIEKISSAGRVCVNGRFLKEASPLQLRHGDKVYLGRAHAFRLVVPLGMNPDDSGFDLSLRGLEDEWSAIQDSPSWQSLQEYLEQVIQQMQPDQARQLYEDMKRACKLCDEANDISAECRADDHFHFEVDLTSTVPSSIVMRVLQADFANSGDAPDSEQCCYATLYLWSVPQMAERLERMRDYHEARMRSGVAEVDPLLDPWYEAHPGAVARRLNELEMLVQVEREQSEQTRLKKYSSMSKTLTVRKRGDIVRCVFGAWASSAAATAAAPAASAAASIQSSRKPRVQSSASGSALATSKRVAARSGAGAEGSAAAAALRNSKGSFRAGAVPQRPTRFVPSRQTERPSAAPRARHPPMDPSGSVSARRGAAPASAPRLGGLPQGGGWSGVSRTKARASSPPGMKRGSFAVAVAERAAASVDGGTVPPPASTAEESSVPPICLPSRGDSTADVSFGAEVETMTDGQRDLGAIGRIHVASDLSPRAELSPRSNMEAALAAEKAEAVDAENEMLRKQLEAAWHLCHVLRNKMVDGDANGPVRTAPQAVGPPKDSRSASVGPASRGRGGSFGEFNNPLAGSLTGGMPVAVSASLLSPRSGQGSNGALAMPGPLYSPRQGQGSNGRRHPLVAAPCGSTALPMAQPTMVATANGMAVMYQPPLPYAAQQQMQVVAPASPMSMTPQPQHAKRQIVERLVSSPLPATPAGQGRTWSYAN